MSMFGYQLNLDALFARIIYRWRGRIAIGLFLLSSLYGLTSGLVPPAWRGKATLSIDAPADAIITVDGRRWPRTLYAGPHTAVATLPDGRVSWTAFTIEAGQALTLTLPVGLPTPEVHAIQPAAPGMRIAYAWWADHAWRVLSEPDTTADATPSYARDAADVHPYSQTVAVTLERSERLSTIDAYNGIADQIQRGGNRIEALAQTDETQGFQEIIVRGWGKSNLTFPISAPATLLHFAPTGDRLIVAEQITPYSQQAELLYEDGRRAQLLAVPGTIRRISWRDDGQAAVIHSRQNDLTTLTLIRLAPTIAAATITELPSESSPHDLIPLAWQEQELVWVAPDAAGVSTLWSAPLASLIPRRRGPLEALALTALPDGSLRVAAADRQRVVIGRYAEGRFIGETILPETFQAPPDLVGSWQGASILLTSKDRAWLVDLSGQSTPQGVRQP